MQTTLNQKFPRLLTVAKVSEYLGISPWGIRARIQKRQLPVVKIGRSVYVDKFELDKQLVKQLVKVK